MSIDNGILLKYCKNPNSVVVYVYVAGGNKVSKTKTKLFSKVFVIYDKHPALIVTKKRNLHTFANSVQYVINIKARNTSTFSYIR
jgi:hypothetical protein